MRSRMAGDGIGSGTVHGSGMEMQQYFTMLSNHKITFTSREKDFLKLVAQGLDNKEISAKMQLAEGTVRNNISHLLEKVEVKDRTQLAVYAVKNGLDMD